MIKSLASSETSLNSSSSKFHSQARMLFSVSLSSSPRNGDKPLSLDIKNNTDVRNRTGCVSVCALNELLDSQHIGDDSKTPHVRGE